jgi:serine/threonine-protein kinase
LPPRSFSPVGATHLALSPDGSRFAYASQGKLLIRRLGAEEAITVEASTVLVANPFFSPDGEWVGFFDGAFKKVPSAGGRPVVMVETTERTAGATWGSDDTIVFATTSGLYAVSANGGAPRFLVRADPTRGERQYAWPHFLPDGRAVVFTILPQGATDAAQIAWLDLETLATQALLTGAAAHYTPTGHLVYTVGQTLMAVGFDAEQRAIVGEPTQLRGVAVATARDNGAAELAISATGTLAFIAPNFSAPPVLSTLAWVDRKGDEEAIALAPGEYGYPRVSPDGTRIALNVGVANRDIWIWDGGRESLTRLTDSPSEDLLPLWTPDGRRVFFASDRAGNFDIYSQAADGSTAATVELANSKFHAPASFSPDGTLLVVGEEFRDLSVLDVTAHSVRPLLHREAIDWSGELSPDGRWLAYESDESGAQFEIYLRPFPDVEGQREQVSVAGGRYAQWGPKGSGELYYVDLAGAMMAVPVELAPTLRIERPTKLFDFMPPGRGGVSARVYDISPIDGRFLRVQPVSQLAAEAVDVAVILNWFGELREQVPRP